jgi:hypothetical protein
MVKARTGADAWQGDWFARFELCGGVFSWVKIGFLLEGFSSWPMRRHPLWCTGAVADDGPVDLLRSRTWRFHALRRCETRGHRLRNELRSPGGP